MQLTGNAIPIPSGDNEKAAKLDAGKADDKKAGKDALKGQPSEAKAVQGQAKAPAKAKASEKAAAKKEEEEVSSAQGPLQAAIFPKHTFCQARNLQN